MHIPLLCNYYVIIMYWVDNDNNADDDMHVNRDEWGCLRSSSWTYWLPCVFKRGYIMMWWWSDDDDDDDELMMMTCMHTEMSGGVWEAKLNNGYLV